MTKKLFIQEDLNQESISAARMRQISNLLWNKILQAHLVDMAAGFDNWTNCKYGHRVVQPAPWTSS